MPTSSSQQFVDITYVNEAPAAGTSPSYFGSSIFKLRGESGKHLIAYATTGFGAPLPPGAVIDSAVLSFRAYEAWSGPTSRTIQIRAVIGPWNPSSITYPTRPATTAAYQVLTTKSNPFSNKELWQFDVTSLAKGLAGPLYGFEIQITSNDTQERKFHANIGEGKYRPLLKIQWSVPPNRPQTLNPSEGRAVSLAKPVVSADFSDYTGNNNFAALQVQTSFTDNFNAPDWGSGEVAASSPMLDLATTSFPGLADGQEVWWRVAVKDTDGNWSPWSASTNFERRIKGTVVITNPPEAPNNVINNPKPEIRWTVTGATQKQFEVTITDANNNIVHYSGRVTSPVPKYVLPLGVMKDLASSYRAYVKVYDDVDRASTPGDTSWIEDVQPFTFDKNASAAPVTNLTATKDPLGRPWVIFEWDRSGSPSAFALAEGNTMLKAELDPADLLVSGNHYTYTYRGVSPRKDHTYTIIAQQGELLSASNPTATIQVRPTTAYLCSDDGRFSVPLTNIENGLNLAEESTSYIVLNAEESTAVYGATRGFEGTFGGVLSNAEGGRTAAQYLADFLSVREEKGLALWLSFADQMVYCVIQKTNYKPVVYVEEITYAVTFEVYQRKGLF